MQFSFVDTRNLDAECLEETDFETERNRIQQRIQLIKNAGGLVTPVICFPNGFENGEQLWEAFEEENNLLNVLAMMELYRENPREWHLTNAWVVDDISQAQTLAEQYLLLGDT